MFEKRNEKRKLLYKSTSILSFIVLQYKCLKVVIKEALKTSDDLDFAIEAFHHLHAGNLGSKGDIFAPLDSEAPLLLEGVPLHLNGDQLLPHDGV